MILIIASDAGPAKYLDLIIKSINYSLICVGSEISENVFSKNNFLRKNIEEIDFENIQLIITGTCLDVCAEKKAIIKAKKKNIPTISIIEHWSHYYERFLLNGKLILPDYIFVNDNKAKKDAILAGLPENIIIVVGNPYLEQLSKRKLYPLTKNKWLQKLKLDNKPVITFISESYRDDFPKDTEEYQGFDEFIVLKSLLKFAKKYDYNLLIRQHPSESKNKYNEYLQDKKIVLDNINDYDSTIINSDYIIGMGSMFLIEASLFRDDIISYRPNERSSFIGNELKLTNKITDEKILNNVLKHRLTVTTKSKYKLIENSLEKINNFISTILIQKIK